MKLKRNKKGQFVKGSGFWTGKKRPGLKTSTTWKKGDIPWNAGTGKPYIRKRKPKPENELIYCACGCNTQLYKYDNKYRLRKMITGHNFWKGGITPMNDLLRRSSKYRSWRKLVYERDDYTCVLCGRKGGALNADHIKPWCDYPELRFAIDNGRTLCIECHRQTDTYGIKYSRLKGGVANAY